MADGWGWLIVLIVVFLVYRRTRSGKRLPKDQPTGFRGEYSYSVPPDDNGRRVSAPSPTRRPSAFPAAARKKGPPVRWVPLGETVQIAGHTIPGGMLYVGDPGDPWSAPKCVINPGLEVASSEADLAGQYMSYWPSYSSMNSISRLAYLQWLEGGRKDPGADIGYVFLYFYGLERRLLKDEAVEEADAILAEVRRLRTIYCNSSSFNRYSADFLDAADLMANPYVSNVPPVPTSEPSYGLSPRLLLSLGHLISEGVPLTADWMLAWLLAHPETRLRTSARRAFDEFCALFRIRFTEKYPTGLKIAPPKSTIGTLSYRVASGDFTADLAGVFSTWPSVARLTKPVGQAMEIAERCMTELDAYSRFLGRSPEAKDSLQAKLLLPPDLLATAGGEVASVLDWLRGLEDTVPVERLLANLGVAVDGGKLGKSVAKAAAEALEGLGFGIEPDVRLGGRTPKLGECVVLFPLADGVRAQTELGATYQATALTLDLCAVVAHADDVVTPEEESRLLELADGNLFLSPVERSRLWAHVRWLMAVPPSMSQLQARISGLAEERRHDLAQFVVAVAAADGHVGLEEMKLLERIYKLLGMEATQLFSDIHAFQADDEPVVVRPAVEVPAGRRIPQPPLAQEQDTQAVVLNMARIERIRSDTAKVSSLLSEIFVEESDQAPDDPMISESADEPAPFDGLDRRHEALLRELTTRAQWARDEFERLCRSMDLLPGGALESLNEWSFERFDEPITEDEDPLIVNLSLIPPLHPIPVFASASGPTP